RDRGEPERARQPLAVRLAVDGEREHRLEQRLELQRGPHLADEANLVLAGVPEAVRHPRLDRRDLAGAERQLLSADLQPERAGGRARVTGDYVSPGWTRPDSYARTTACTRSRRSSFVRVCPTCVLTVVSLTNSSFAISPFESPRAISFRTSSSRAVSSSSFA